MQLKDISDLQMFYKVYNLFCLLFYFIFLFQIRVCFLNDRSQFLFSVKNMYIKAAMLLTTLMMASVLTPVCDGGFSAWKVGLCVFRLLVKQLL